MHKKICSYIVVIVFSTSFMFGMECDNILHELVRKDVISTLSVNDYIVNVSSAYQGLLKEACFKQDILRNMIKKTNKALEERVAEKSCKGYRLFDQKLTERFFDRSIAYLKIPCFRYMELTYKNASEFERRGEMDADVKITTFCYYISSITISSKMKCDSNPCIIMGDNNKTGVASWEQSIPILQKKIEKTCIFGKKRG